MYKEFYESIKPVINEKTIQQVMEYMSYPENSFYDSLLEMKRGCKVCYNSYDSNALEQYLYEKYIQKITRETHGKILPKNIPTKLSNSEYICFILDDLSEKMPSLPIYTDKDMPNWRVLDSSYFTDEKMGPIEHRLYLNPSSNVAMGFIYRFIQSCAEAHLPYYLKYRTDYLSKDLVVCYTSTEALLPTISLIKEVVERFGIEKHMSEAPLLTGKIEPWLGYGASPLTQDQNESYHSLREKFLEKIIIDENKKWFAGQVELSQNENCYSIIEALYPLYVDYFEHSIEKGDNFEKGEICVFLEEGEYNITYKQLISELKKQELMEELYNALILGKERKLLVYNGHRARQTSIKGLLPFLLSGITKNIPSVVDRIEKRISSDAKHLDIDSENFCFSNKTLKDFQELDEKQRKIEEAKLEVFDVDSSKYDLEQKEMDSKMGSLQKLYQKIKKRYN